MPRARLGLAREPGRMTSSFMTRARHDPEWRPAPTWTARAGWPARRTRCAVDCAWHREDDRLVARPQQIERVRSLLERVGALGHDNGIAAPLHQLVSRSYNKEMSENSRSPDGFVTRPSASTTATSASSGTSRPGRRLEPGLTPHRWRAESKRSSPERHHPHPRQAQRSYPHVVASVGRSGRRRRGSRPTRRRRWPSPSESSPQSTVRRRSPPGQCTAGPVTAEHSRHSRWVPGPCPRHKVATISEGS